MSDYVSEQITASSNRGFTSPEAEENILRRCIMRQGVAEEYAIELQPDDFSNPEYARFWRAIQSLVGRRQQVDMVSIDAEMTRLYGNAWTPITLVGLTKETAFTIAKWQDIQDQIKIVRDLSRRRQAIAQLEGLVAGLQDPTKEIGETLSAISDAADGIDTGDSEWVSIGDVLMSTFSHLEKRQKGEIKSIATGIGALDRLIGGLFAGELTILAARPSGGKSAFGASVALTAARNGVKVGVVSCEMDKEGMGQRLFSNGALIDGMKLRRAEIDDDAWGKLVDAMAEMDGLPFQFLFDSNYCEDIIKTARKLARKGELELLIVDYLQFMDCHRKFKEERHRVGFMVRSFKKLAKRANIPVLLLSQLTREGEGQMPTMKMLRESGDIEQDADGIIFLHKPESPNDKSVDPRDKDLIEAMAQRGMRYIIIGVAKQRNGAIGQVPVIFDGAYMRYAEIARE